MRYFKIIYLIILGILFVPVLEQHLGLFKIVPLNGYFTPELKPKWTIESYIDKFTFQEQAEKYANENFGFRNTLLRLRNQIYFSVFNQSPIADYTIGKNRCLFQSNYIDAYYGNDFVGDTILDDLTFDIKSLQDTLAKHHVTLLTVIAPSKAWYFSENLPASFDLTPNDSNTNYSVFKTYANSKKINLMDFNQLFLRNKSMSEFPLYTKSGTHWSFYSATTSFDSILRKLEILRGVEFPKMVYQYAEKNINENSSDFDVVRTFNLMKNPTNLEKIYIPHVMFKKINGYTPRVLGVTDSYYGVFYELDLLKKAFHSPDYWFGYQIKFPKEKYNGLKTDNSELKTEINAHEVVVLLCTPHNIHKLGWGFVQEALQSYGQQETKYNYKEVVRLEDNQAYLKSNVEWMQGVLLQAKLEHLDSDKHFVKYTKWMTHNDMKK